MTDTVGKRSEASQAMVDMGLKGRALMGGTAAMRKAGKAYLPEFPQEDAKAYEARRDQSWLFNGYKKTVKDMSGRVFEKPVTLGESAPESLKTWAENIDLQGRDLSTFSREVFEDGLSGTGISYIMVEAPAREGEVTKQEAKDANLRPYLIHLKQEEVLGWKTETVNNVTTLSQIRILETIKESDPKDEFAEVEVEQVRVIDRADTGATTRIYRKGKDAKWAEQPEMGSFSQLSEITVVPFYAARTGFFTGEPILDDLSDVNIAHWQSQSDQRNILHAVRVPILFGSGVGQDDIVISASTAITSDDPQASLMWVEHSGAAINAGRQDLKDLEFQMETHGLQLLVAQNGQSATGEALDAAKETSILAMTADQLKDALEQAIAWMGEYAGEDFSAEVTVNKDFGVSLMGAQEFTAMLAAVNTGQLSQETFITEMNARGFLRTEVSPDEEKQRIEDEGGDLTDVDDTDADLAA